ncbi:glycosyltransferase involved in cell wall biosynthesis [Kineococcus aurantiacus]|uniref:Glycosyltransferase involved in cell wall biosynthesis n=1 Tax=Kineococcus aurantiacus TaxID=37633 RepID=A0A7Y9DPK1_9ACTN|nr:glycosyltransferase involved in cell wall biosynthesis [Kineococcus aurantiacus]
MAQDPPPAEVVVCDDGSKDASATVAASFGPAVRLVRHRTNQGEAAAKNTAVRTATSPWVAVLDADDEWLPGRLQAVRDLLTRRPELDLVTTDAQLVHDGRVLGRWYGPHYPFAWEDQRRKLLERNFVFGHVVVRREAFLAVGGFDPAVRHATDWDCWIRMAFAGARLGLVPEPLARYHLHEGSLSSDRGAMASSIATFLRRRLHELPLTAAERVTAEGTAREQDRQAARYRLKSRLATQGPATRAAAWRVLTDTGQPVRSRAIAGLAGVAPGLVGRVQSHRDTRTWIGPGDVRLPRTTAPEPPAAAPAPRRPRVLLTLPDRPWPADGGKRLRCSTTLRALADLPGVDLDVAVLFAGPPVPRPLPPGVRVATVLQVDAGPRRRLPGMLASAVRVVPWQIAVVRWGVARRALRPLRDQRYDLVWFGYSDHAVSLGRTLRGCRTVVDMDDVETAKLRSFLALPADSPTTRRAVRWQRRVERPLWAAVEERVRRIADTVVVCSDLDRTRVAGPRTEVVPNSYPPPAQPRPARPLPERPVLLVVGTYHYPPNVDAAVHAATRVLPLVRELVPGTRLRLVGRGGVDLLADLNGLPGVEVVGDVEDIDAELAGADVALVPVRYGGGTRVKVLEAFAHGVPVVSTRLGSEGLDALDGVHLLHGNTPGEMAEACRRVLQEEGLGTRLAEAAQRLHEQRYRPEVARAAVQRVARRHLGLPTEDTGPPAGSTGT